MGGSRHRGTLLLYVHTPHPAPINGNHGRIANDILLQFLTLYIISLLRIMDLRSEHAIELLSEFLDSTDVWIPDPPTQGRGRGYNADRITSKCENENFHKHAEHFAHGQLNFSCGVILKPIPFHLRYRHQSLNSDVSFRN